MKTIMGNQGGMWPNAQKPYIPTKTVYELAKAGRNGTYIYGVIDESGSMVAFRDATIEGFNNFIRSQREVKNVGRGFLTLLKFDAPELKKSYVKRPLEEVPLLSRETYNPRGGTNLNDAIGTAIYDIHTDLSGIPMEERPGVLVMIMTDGYENSSTMYSANEIKQMVRSAEDYGDWTFTFLGANIDTFAVGSAYGFNQAAVASYSTQNMASTLDSVSLMATNVRSAKAAGFTTSDIYAAGLYSEEDRNKMTK